jgi:hypothetical protein
LIKRIIRAQSRAILRSLFIDKDIKAAKEKMKMSGLTILSCIANAFKKRK